MTVLGTTPYLSVRDARAAIAFYEKAFGATPTAPPLTGPDGAIVHAELAIGGLRFMLSEEAKEWGNHSPPSLGGTPVRIAVDTDDVDAFAERAIRAGAEELIPVADQFYGHRSGRLRDPFGHEWILSQLVEEMSAEEMQRRADELFSPDDGG